MKHRRTLLVAVAGLALGAGLWGGMSPGGADSTATVTAAAWWTTRPAAPPRNFHSVEVAQGLLEAESVAAIRIATSGPAGSVTLSMPEVDGLNQSGATILVCLTSDAWEATDAGALDDAPAADCSASAPLTRAEDGTSWSAEIGPLLSGTSSSLELVPAVAEGGLPTVFQVGLGPATLTVAPGTAPTPTTFATGAGSPVTAPPSRPPAVAPTPIAPRVAVVPTPRPAPVEAPIVTVPVTFPGQAATFTPDVSLTSTRSGTNRPWGRLVFFVPLSAVAGAGALATRRWVEARTGLA